MKFHIIFIVLAFCMARATFAQDEFRKPVKKETDLDEALFALPAYQYNHIFQAAMPGDNFLLIDFKKMSYWPDTQVLHEVFDIANSVATQVRDSFTSSVTSKRIDIHVPLKGRPLEVRLNDHHTGSAMLVLDYGQQHVLKSGMDTIRILKTFIAEHNKDEEDIQGVIQYTFVLKDIDEITKLSENRELIAGMANAFDSVVQYRRSKWHDEDIWYHQVGIKYTATETDKSKQTEVKKPAGFVKGLDANYYIGASLFRNSLVPYLEIGGSYKWPGNVGEYDYFRLSFSTLAQFERLSESTYNFYNTSFVNAEMGTLINKTDSWIPVYETSIGLGYMFTDHPSLKQYKTLKMFFNYSLSPAVRITPDFYILFKKKQDNDVWAGLTLTLKFF